MLQQKLYYLEQITLLSAWAEMRTPLLNFIFKTLSFFDSEAFMVILITILILGVKRIWGLRLAYLYYLSYLINHSLKHFFHLPRPCSIYPSLGMDTFYGYGFPSGGAQSAAIVFSLLAIMSKGKFKWLWAVSGMIAIALSRVYIGAHFFTDVIAGLFVGGLIITGFYFFHERIESLIQKSTLRTQLLLSFVFSLVILFTFRTNGTVRCSGAFLGMSLGLVVSHYLKLHLVDSKIASIRLIRVALGLVFLVSIHLFFKAISHSVRPYSEFVAFYAPHFFIGMWLSLGTAWGLVNHERLNR